MNEENLRQQSNVIYGAPCEIVAMGESRNLVQGAQPTSRKKTMEESVADLDKILDFGRPLSKDKDKKEQTNKNIAQGGLTNCKRTQNLVKILNFGVSE